MSGIRKATFAMLVVVVIASVVATGERAQAESLTVGAAYSLRPVFHEIVPMFERQWRDGERSLYARRKVSLCQNQMISYLCVSLSWLLWRLNWEKRDHARSVLNLILHFSRAAHVVTVARPMVTSSS